MTTVLLIIHLFVTFALIGVVLIQRSEGGGLGIGTSQGMGAFMSGRGTANLLTRTTAILGAIFFLLSLSLALLNRGTAGVGHSLLDTLPTENSAPLAPPVPTAPGPVVPSGNAPAASPPATNNPPPSGPAPAAPSTGAPAATAPAGNAPAGNGAGGAPAGNASAPTATTPATNAPAAGAPATAPPATASSPAAPTQPRPSVPTN